MVMVIVIVIIIIRVDIDVVNTSMNSTTSVPDIIVMTISKACRSPETASQEELHRLPAFSS